MNQYNGRLQSILESEQEYTDLYGMHNRQGSMQGSQFNYEDSSMGKILNSKNLNSMQLQQSQLQKSIQDTYTTQKYLGKSYQHPLSNGSSYQSQQFQSQIQKNTLNHTNDDHLTVQNGMTSKHFFDENSIDLSFINFLNKDDAQNANNPASRGNLTNRNGQQQTIFQSYGQLSSIPNLNTSNNLTQIPSTIMGGQKPSQQVQEKYQQGIQNINDLANILTSTTHTPDRIIQNKATENSNFHQSNNQAQPQKLISQQYDEIMAKYQNILQNSQNDKVNEVSPQQSPEYGHNDSVKINDYSEQIYQISDSQSHSNLAFNQNSEPITPSQPVEHKRLTSIDFVNNIKPNNNNERKNFSPSSRQFTFDQNNEMRSSSLSLNNNMNKLSINSVLTTQMNNEFNSNGYNQGINSNPQQQANLLNNNNDIKYNTISKLSSLINEEKVKQTSNNAQFNYNLMSGGAIDSTSYGLYTNQLQQPYQTQQPSGNLSLNHQQSNNPNSIINQATNLSLNNEASTQALANQHTNNQNLTSLNNYYIPSSILPATVTPSQKSLQYDLVVAKYLPKSSNQQQSQYQNIYNSQLNQNNSIASSTISNCIGNQSNVNQSHDSKAARERSNSINKVATARELLENFSATKKKDNQFSPQPRQPLGLIQNNLVNSQLSERFNSLSSAQKMKESNTFQQLNLKESNGLIQYNLNTINQNDQSNKNSQYISTQQMSILQTQQDDFKGIPQYKPLYIGNTSTTDNIVNRNSQYNTPLNTNLTEFQAQNFSNSNAGTIYSTNGDNKSQQTNKRLSFERVNIQTTPSEATQQTLSTYNYQPNNTEFGQNKNQIQISTSTSYTPLNYNISTPSQNQFGVPNTTPVSNIGNVNPFYSYQPSIVDQNTQPYVRTNNHMSSVNSYQSSLPAVPSTFSNQPTERKQSGYNETNKQISSSLEKGSNQKRQSQEKVPILDAKSLLQQREEQMKQQQQQQLPVEQKPLNIQVQQQTPFIQQQQYQSDQIKEKQLYQTNQMNLVQPQQSIIPDQQFKVQQTQQISTIPFSQSIPSEPFNTISERPSNRPTVYSTTNKELMIPTSISPISTPKSKQLLPNLDNDLEYEFNEFMYDLQTQQPQQGKDVVKRTLKPSQSQPFLRTFNFGQKEIENESQGLQSNMVASLSKPKRKIFEDNSNTKQGSKNKTLKMNQQMLKNVLNFQKPPTPIQNEANTNTRVKTEQNHNSQGQDTYLVKEILFSEQFSDFNKAHNSFNPNRQSNNNNNNTNYVPPKSKYIIPAKNDLPVQNQQPYLANLNENGLPGSLNNLDKQQRFTNGDFSSKQDPFQFGTDYKNPSKKEFNIFENKTNYTPSQRQTQYDNSSYFRPSEVFSQADRQSNQKQGNKIFGFPHKQEQKEDVKDMIRTIKSDEELEENIKRTKLTKSKSTARIFNNSPKNCDIIPQQSIQVTTPVNSFIPVPSTTFNEPSNSSKFSHNSRPHQSYNNFNYPQITENDRKTLQIAEQKMRSNVQDISTLAIPILCINCDHFYEQKDIENHICIPSSSNQNKGNKLNQRDNNNFNNFSSQNYLNEKEFSTEDSLINDKISVIFQKIKEQPNCDEQSQIKQLIERILQSNLSIDELMKECRSLSHLNKTVEKIKSRAGLSLLILSQRAEVLLKDKIDIHKKREAGNNQNPNNTFKTHNLTTNTNQDQNQIQSVPSSSNNRANINQNTNNLNIYNDNQQSDYFEVTEMNFNFNKTDRVQTERMTANPNHSANRLPTNSSPNVQSIQTQKFLETPTSQASNANLFSNYKNKIFSPPVTKIFTYNNNPETSNSIANIVPNYNEQVEVQSTTNYSKKRIGFNNQNNDDAQSQYSSSAVSIESRDLLKKYNQSTSLIKFNESTIQTQQKRQFYNIALNLKLKLPTNHPARDCIISEMYTQAEKLNVQEMNYQSYIENYFKQFKC